VSHAWISLLVFVAADSLFVFLPNRRSITAYTGGLLIVLTGVLGWREAFFEKIGWKRNAQNVAKIALTPAQVEAP
jgi:Na+/H+ antiporter NhaD/arsenite permease-like protein